MVVVPARQAENRFSGSVKGLQIRAQVKMLCVPDAPHVEDDRSLEVRV
jgi:hypothetical protein